MILLRPTELGCFFLGTYLTLVGRGLVCTACAFICCLPLRAQVKSRKRHTGIDSSLQLHEVMVLSSKLSERATSASPVQILKSGELTKLNSLSVADALRFFSGVQLKDYGGVGGLKTVNVRSLGSNHTAVFYDGVEFSNAQNGQVDLGKFSLDNIAELRLYSIQKNSIFLPAKGFASGSSIYITTQQPELDSGRHFSGKIKLKAGSFGLVSPSVFWHYKLCDAFHATISAELIRANGRYRFRSTDGGYDTSALRKNADITAQRVEMGLYGRLKDSSAWNMKGYLYHSVRGLPAAVVRNHFESNQRQWERNAFVQASYVKTLERYRFMLNVKYSKDFSRYLDPERVIVVNGASGFQDDQYVEHEWYMSLANKYRITSFWDISLAGDFQRNTLKITENNAEKYPYASPVREQWLTVAASELHFKRLNLQGSLLSTFVNDRASSLAPLQQKREYTPAFLFSWQPSERPDLHVRASFKNTFRLPTFNELYFTFVDQANLKPEFARQANIGLSYSKGFQGQALLFLSIQTDAYFNQVINKIVAVPGQNLARWTVHNLGNVHIGGLDIDAQATWSLLQGLALNTRLSYTYQRARDVSNASDAYNGQIPYTPKNSGSFVLSADWRKISLNYSFVYTGERYNAVDNIPANYVSPWYTHDLGCNYTINVGKSTFKLTAEMNNLLNQRYEVIKNFPMPGFNYRFTISALI